MHRAVSISLLLGALGGLVLSGCGRSEGAGPLTDRPTVLRMAHTVNEEEPEERKHAYRELGVHMSAKLGMPVEIVEANGYGTAVEALRSGKLDICSSSPMPYLVAQAKVGVVPLVVPAMPDGTPSTYYSIFITHPGSGLKTLADIKARAASLTFAFADPASTSGHLIPRAQLETMGLDAEKDFKRVVFASNHTASVLTVKSGKVDVAAVTKTLLDRMVRDGRIKAGEVVTLWQSPPMYQSVLYTRKTLDPAMRARLVDYFVTLAKERPDIWTGMRSQSTSGSVGFTPANDAMFDEFRAIAHRLEHIRLLD